MTVEIRELVIEARVASEERQTQLPQSPRTLPDDTWIEEVTRRVLENLRERGWRAI